MLRFSVVLALALASVVFAQEAAAGALLQLAPCAPGEDRLFISEAASSLVFQVCFSPSNGKMAAQPLGSFGVANRLHATHDQLFSYNSYDGSLSWLFIGEAVYVNGEYRLPNRGRVVGVEGNTVEMHFPVSSPRRVYLYGDGDYFLGRPEGYRPAIKCTDSAVNGAGYWCLMENGQLMLYPLTLTGLAPEPVFVAEKVTGIAATTGGRVVYTTQTEWACPLPAPGQSGECFIKALGEIAMAEYSFQSRRASRTRIALALTNGDSSRGVLAVRDDRVYFVSDDQAVGSQLLMLDLKANRQWLVFGRRELADVTRVQYDRAWVAGFALAPSMFPPPPRP